MSLIFPYSFGGLGSGAAGSDIQVFKSTDFPRLTSSNATYPVVSFEGHAGGKILAIVPLNKTYRHIGTEKPARYIGSMLSVPSHYGNNMFAPTKETSQTYNGVTMTNLCDGGFKITGTATSNQTFVLGPVFTRFYEDDNHRPTVKCFGVSGTCGSLKVGNTYYGDQYKYNVNGGSGEIKFYSSFRYLYLYCTSGETYNCIFYPQITDAYLGIQNHYEKPFSVKRLNDSMFTNDIVTAVQSSPFGGVLSNSTVFDSVAGNYTVRDGIVNYPIIHCGTNHIIGPYTSNYDSTKYDICDFAVYYAENYQKTEEGIINDSTIACMLNRGARPKVSGTKYMGGGSGYAWTITVENSYYVPTQYSFIKPDGVEFKYSASSSSSSNINTMYYNDDRPNNGAPSGTTIYYYTFDEFKWSDDSYKYLTLDLQNSISNSYYVTYQMFFDYDGFDDTPHFQTL